MEEVHKHRIRLIVLLLVFAFQIYFVISYFIVDDFAYAFWLTFWFGGFIYFPFIYIALFFLGKYLIKHAATKFVVSMIYFVFSLFLLIPIGLIMHLTIMRVLLSS